ncbi:hypothetical protein [Ligilactobacillus aviarius]|uniref:hypothetical protein n=2 Tax=Ligilactobacillus aviarius TaxID=1606 RepID=UPI0024BAAC83|nr:hypothetical protein [Ligilactobacillus aviarius]
MQIVMMITSVLVSAVISWLVARLQVKAQINQKRQEHLADNQEMFAKWIVYENDMIRVLQAKRTAEQFESYQKAERNLVVQMALIGLEYHAARYDELLQELTTFTNTSRNLQKDLDLEKLSDLISLQKQINRDLRQVIAQQYQNLK